MAPGAFGLAIASDAGLPGLDAPGGVAGARRAEHRLVEEGGLAERLGEGSLTSLGRSGEGSYEVEYCQHPSGAVLIRSQSFGEHLINAGGRSVLSSVGGAETGLWQRYVLGQVLPLTASVQGLEIFHASAVAVGDRVLALAGPAGSGKSSVAAALAASGGAAFFADDVLALDATAFGLTAYPGTTLIGVPRERVGALESRLELGPAWAVDERKAIVPVRGERRALPVRAFVRLTRDEGASEVAFEPCLPDRLMATTFDGVSRGAERRLRLLRVGAMLAADNSALELRYPPDASPVAIAGALRDRLDLAKAADGGA
jgi:hypothetical protein